MRSTEVVEMLQQIHEHREYAAGETPLAQQTVTMTSGSLSNLTDRPRVTMAERDEFSQRRARDRQNALLDEREEEHSYERERAIRQVNPLLNYKVDGKIKDWAEDDGYRPSKRGSADERDGNPSKMRRPKQKSPERPPSSSRVPSWAEPKSPKKSESDSNRPSTSSASWTRPQQSSGWNQPAKTSSGWNSAPQVPELTNASGRGIPTRAPRIRVNKDGSRMQVPNPTSSSEEREPARSNWEKNCEKKRKRNNENKHRALDENSGKIPGRMKIRREYEQVMNHNLKESDVPFLRDPDYMIDGPRILWYFNEHGMAREHSAVSTRRCDVNLMGTLGVTGAHYNNGRPFRATDEVN